MLSDTDIWFIHLHTHWYVRLAPLQTTHRSTSSLALCPSARARAPLVRSSGISSGAASVSNCVYVSFVHESDTSTYQKRGKRPLTWYPCC